MKKNVESRPKTESFDWMKHITIFILFESCLCFSFGGFWCVRAAFSAAILAGAILERCQSSQNRQNVVYLGKKLIHLISIRSIPSQKHEIHPKHLLQVL